MIKIKLHGYKELTKQLDELKKLLSYSRVMARAAAKAFKPVLETARANAPEDTGLLKRRIKMKVIRPKLGTGWMVAVGLYVGTKPGPKTEARNWAWYERGIPSRGIAAQPFFRAALDQNAELVTTLFKEALAVEIRNALRGGK